MKGHKTLKQICKKSGVKYHTLWRKLCKSGVKVVRIGTVMLVRDRDVPRVLAAGE